jgi:uncharacterized protein YndB with AHSA1/START domain
MTSRVYLALRVPASPQRAFEAFTQEIASWWQPSGLFRISRQGDGTLRFEPGVGGRLLTRLPSGRELEIGRLAAWEPGHRLLFSWRQESFEPDQLTEVEVLFEAVGRKRASRSSIGAGIASRAHTRRGMGSRRGLPSSTWRAGGAHR